MILQRVRLARTKALDAEVEISTEHTKIGTEFYVQPATTQMTNEKPGRIVSFIVVKTEQGEWVPATVLDYLNDWVVR